MTGQTEKKKKTNNPKSRTTQLNLRLTVDEKIIIDSNAEKVGKKTSEYARDVLIYNVYQKDSQNDIQSLRSENQELLQKQTEFLGLLSSKEDTNRKLLDMLDAERNRTVSLIETIESFENRSFGQKLRDLFRK